LDNSKKIIVGQPRILKNRLLMSEISCSRSLEKYFRRKAFFAEYDVDISNVPSSILQVPVFSNIIPVAWAVGADVYIKELDKSYLNSLKQIKSVMSDWYPKLSFSTNIHVKNVVSNRFSNPGYGMLFSGGVDSTATYIRYKKQKPNLIRIWGADIPLAQRSFWRKIKNKYKNFARQENVELNVIRSNIREFLCQVSLDIHFSRYLTRNWWESIQHGLGMLGLCAPTTIVKHIGTLLIASSVIPDWYPYGSQPLTDSKLSWADIKVVNTGGLSRQEKISHVLKNYIETSGRHPLLRVCTSQYRQFNCSECEKCCRTIIGLVLANIDPNKCGFNVDHNFFQVLKRNLINGKVVPPFFSWSDIQRHIPESISHNLHDSREFFNWLRDFDIQQAAKHRKISAKDCLFYIYCTLPWNVRKAVAMLHKCLSHYR